jgi:hypothetical protein
MVPQPRPSPAAPHQAFAYAGLQSEHLSKVLLNQEITALHSEVVDGVAEQLT